MSKQLQNIKVRLDESLDEKLRLLEPNYSSYRILRKSVDARKRNELHEVYSLEVFYPGEDTSAPDYPVEKINYDGKPILIVGSGPAGLFAALRLVERGVPCILFERGAPTNQRMIKINRYWRYGELDTDNNVCFGEGGAGLYSDGKLITRIKSPYIPYVMHRLVKFGAPEEIQYLANPHVGSDRIRRVIPKLRDYLIENGCTIHFNAKVEELLTSNNKMTGLKLRDGRVFEGDHIILATGHSANDMFYHLNDLGVAMEGKSFAVGLRVEHPQKAVNEIQYRGHAEHPKLGAANYKLTHHDYSDNIGVYSFCMCPGGYVLSSATDVGSIVSNGMSNYHRNSPFANSAIVISVDYQKNFGSNPFHGLDWRNKLEKDAFDAVIKAGGTKQLPAQRLTDFIKGKTGPLTEKNSSPSDGIATRVDLLLPDWIRTRLIEAFHKFDDSMKGFLHKDAQVFGVESRTSCPIRISRDDTTLESLSHKGLYPCGEGAGYAGGITSAAVDGIKIVEAILKT
ncbi:MAG: FAD-dependent oxidoreductase [Bdellovibrionales bacterium]|nr:FAD-dependent oxidoreductase [Bdellovibrionales bacterium]